MENLTFYAIIVAGGAGKRMNSAIPKQFLDIAGKPILMHTIEKFSRSTYNPKIILVLSAADISIWEQKVAQYSFDIPHQIVSGGKERFFSVKSGLDTIREQNSIIAIHDAVRPLVSLSTIDSCYSNAIENGNAIAAIVSKDSIRIKNIDHNQAISRDLVYLVQTPQTFSFGQLSDAYKQEFSKDFTDDASVVEKSGYDIFLEDGDQFNMKITYEEDLIIAEALIKNQC
ncbi:MAG: 2-C-methyl-D-erythritol 4-phosphate cytidylyltransferase [Flavobacterium sp.]|nr:MAG: 2-C-methyl-D-erythritol 4-phosphate cytidylyltransferase [Flavobacterium sp.]